MADKPEKICPYCARPIRGKNTSILEVNYALHLKKHELRGDSMDLSLPQRVASALESTPVNAVVIIVGYLIGGWAVANLWKVPLPWFYVAFTSIFVPSTAYVKFRARQHLRTYIRVIRIAGNWTINLIVGTLVSSLVILLEAWIPYYQNPYVLIQWSLYFTLIVCMLFMQRVFQRPSVSRRLA